MPGINIYNIYITIDSNISIVMNYFEQLLLLLTLIFIEEKIES